MILPALLALASQRPDISGGQFLDAYVTGVEMAGRLGLAAGSQHYKLGFHNTATLGTIAASAACARLVDATERQTALILGLAATQSAGLRAQFGSDVKPLHAGLAAQTAVIATQLTLAFTARQTTCLTAFYRLTAPVSNSRKNSFQTGARRGGLSRPVWNSNPIRPAVARTALPMPRGLFVMTGCKPVKAQMH